MTLAARFLAAALLVTTAALPQVSTARLEGTVQDSTGAVIPGAQVQALNLKTQIAVETKADAEGRFTFASLAPSDYTLSVETAGFRKSVMTGLKLGVAETVTQIIVLELGAVTESVTAPRAISRTVQTCGGCRCSRQAAGKETRA